MGSPPVVPATAEHAVTLIGAFPSTGHRVANCGVASQAASGWYDDGGFSLRFQADPAVAWAAHGVTNLAA